MLTESIIHLLKKVILIITTVILLTTTANCQWLNRYYGVNDYKQLSDKQLNDALIKAKDGVTGGIVLMVAGAIGIGTGYYVIQDSKDKLGSLQAIPGAALLVLSVPAEIIGLVVLVNNSERQINIKRAMKNIELKVGLINYRSADFSSGSKDYLLPCLSVTIRF
jgi:hypothetical protein